MFDRHQSTCCASFGIGVGEHEWRRSTVPARIQILPDETLRRRVVSKPITSIGRGLERKVAADAWPRTVTSRSRPRSAPDLMRRVSPSRYVNQDPATIWLDK